MRREAYHLENELQARVLALLKARRAKDHTLWYYKAHDVCTGGIPDIAGCWRGVPFYCELKRPGERPEPLQRKTLQDLRDAGAVAWWADKLEKFKNIFDRIELIVYTNCRVQKGHILGSAERLIAEIDALAKIENAKKQS